MSNITKHKTTKKMKIIGSQEYINKDTGEVEKMNVIKMEDRDFNFDKIWIAHILESLEAIGNQKIKVMTELLKLKNADNLIITTQRKLAKSINVSPTTVNETIQTLVESNFLQIVQKGVYRINPDHLFKGGNSKRLNILLEYNKTQNDIEEVQIDDNPDTFLITDKKE